MMAWAFVKDFFLDKLFTNSSLFRYPANFERFLISYKGKYLGVDEISKYPKKGGRNDT